MPKKLSSGKGRTRKHVPQRTCIGCRQVQSKREMVRLVRTPEGELVIDETGKQNGRGAYLCRQPSCWDAALKGQQLGKSLKMEIGEREIKVLRGFELELVRQSERERARDVLPESDPGS
jgi:predicted RNA-binding protein YlxR (DUF448 family)